MADVIVVGAGSAGAVVARRLHDLGAEVLVLESGPAEGGAAVADPARMHELWDSPLDWGWRTVPQPAAGDRRLHLPRGRVLGGSHALNGMIWARGCPRDYDGWAAAGNPGWAWRDVLPAFRRIEAYDEPGALRGAAGPLPILTRWEPLPVQRSIVAAAVAAGVPFNPDYNGVRPEGVSYMQYTIAGGRRRTTAEAYLRPALDRPGMTVRTGVTVRRLLLPGDRSARCTGVEWTAGPGGRSGAPERARAGTVVLCAGAGDADAVVDARLRVHGVAGLRVADASVMPRIPTGNTNAPTVMIGERAAEFVAAETTGR